MQSGLDQLKILTRWTVAGNYTLTIQPIRTYQIMGQPGTIEESHPGEAHTW